MQIVIDISDIDYNNIKEYGTILDECRDDIAKAIVNGTPLPKGHGRLIDADELKRIIQGNDVLSMKGFNVRICDINATPTIVEADKSESRK